MLQSVLFSLLVLLGHISGVPQKVIKIRKNQYPKFEVVTRRGRREAINTEAARGRPLRITVFYNDSVKKLSPKDQAIIHGKVS